MFNETCIVFESYLLDYPQSMGKWIRSCPKKVKSCFWAKGAFNGEAPTFRGCADATYDHEHKCTRELQAVTVVEAEKHVDVDVQLCYCGNEKCNEQRNGITNVQKNYYLIITLLLLLNNFSFICD